MTDFRSSDAIKVQWRSCTTGIVKTTAMARTLLLERALAPRTAIAVVVVSAAGGEIKAAGIVKPGEELTEGGEGGLEAEEKVEKELLD